MKKEAQDPCSIRNKAIENLASVLGKGEMSLYARYVQKQTSNLSFEQVQYLEKTFTEGWQADFEKAIDRLVGNSQKHFHGRKQPLFYNKELILPWEKRFSWDA